MFAPLQEHSHKPEEHYAVIERISDGPYLELFARRRPPAKADWSTWGEEVAADIVIPGYPVPSAERHRKRGTSCRGAGSAKPTGNRRRIVGSGLEAYSGAPRTPRGCLGRSSPWPWPEPRRMHRLRQAARTPVMSRPVTGVAGVGWVFSQLYLPRPLEVGG
jgi:hypothetical protein